MHIFDRQRALKSPGGFTLVELLVVISILGVLAAVVVLNVTGFMGAGRDEAKAVELKQVSTAAGAYLFEGGPLGSATTVGPGDLGILDNYLTGDLKYYWSIDSDGSVHELLFGSSLNGLDGFSATGNWTPVNGSVTSNGQGTLLANSGNWSDFTFQTSANVASGDGYGMYYRFDSTANTGYIFQFDSAGFTISDVASGTTLWQQALPPSFSVSGQHNISVSVSGNTHTINVDGTSMTFTDTGSTYGSGTVGLQTGTGSDINFTGFTVSPP